MARHQFEVGERVRVYVHTAGESVPGEVVEPVDATGRVRVRFKRYTGEDAEVTFDPESGESYSGNFTLLVRAPESAGCLAVLAVLPILVSRLQ